MGILRNRYLWKGVFLVILLVVVFGTISTNFEDPVFPGWNTPLKAITPSSSQEAGAKAAVLAMAGAASLFVSLIPVQAGRPGERLDFMVRLVGAAAALFAGLYWLVGETGGRPSPYLIALVPSMFVMGTIMLGAVSLSYAQSLDVRNRRGEQLPRLLSGWWFVAWSAILWALLLGFFLVLMPLLTSQLFGPG